MKKQTIACIFTGHLLKGLLAAAPFILEYFGGTKMGVHRYLLFVRYHYPDSLFAWPGPGAWIFLVLALIGFLLTLKLVTLSLIPTRIRTIYFVEGVIFFGMVFIGGGDLFRHFKAYPFFVLAGGSALIVHLFETALIGLSSRT